MANQCEALVIAVIIFIAADSHSRMMIYKAADLC
jgi:hypothetical protein